MTFFDFTKRNHCDTSLDSIDNQPCPNYGRKKRIIDLTLKDEMQMGDDLVVSVISGKTNRSVIHSDSINETDTAKLEKLIIRYVQSLVNLTSYIETFAKDFNNRLSLNEGVFYRAVDSSIKKDLSSNQIGPSPKGASDGRYNTCGEKCIYLIDRVDFLYDELNSSSILTQKFKITTDKLQIADFSSENKNLHNNLSLAFDMAERGMTSSGYPFEDELQSHGQSRYLVSQLLSTCFKKHAWDGLYIPGIHGNSGQQYHNLVIFGPAVDQWEKWADGCYFPMERHLCRVPKFQGHLT